MLRNISGSYFAKNMCESLKFLYMFNNLHFRKRDLYQSSNLNKQLGETYSSFKCYYNHCRTGYATITGSFWHFHYLTGLFTLVQNYSTKFIETILLYPFRICSEVTLKPSWNTSWYNWFFYLLWNTMTWIFPSTLS